MRKERTLHRHGFFESETMLVDASLRALHKNLGGAAIGREIRSHGTCRTDIVVVIDDHVTAIEAKLTNWRRAITQAYFNRLCADSAYILMPSERVSDAVLLEALRHGVGVMTIEGEELQVRLPAPETTPRARWRDALITAVQASNLIAA